MAGAYPDFPGPRIAYDKDGSQVYQVSTSNVVTAYSQAQATAWNNETNGGSGLGGAYLLIIFPVLMDLVGVYLCAGGLGATIVSSDTTNGIDGTWTTTPTIPSSPISAISPYYRTQINPVSLSGVKAIKFNALSGQGIYKVHLYGQPSAVADRLEFWHPTLDQSLNVTPAWLDWGNRPRGTTATKQFRIKNRSGSLTASSITVGMEAPTDSPTPTYVSQHDFSLDGVSYSPTVVVSSLAPGAISAPITVRQTLSASASISLWTQRIYGTVGAWA